MAATRRDSRDRRGEKGTERIGIANDEDEGEGEGEDEDDDDDDDDDDEKCGA